MNLRNLSKAIREESGEAIAKLQASDRVGEGNIAELHVTITVTVMLVPPAPNSGIWNTSIHLTSLTVTSSDSEVSVQKKYAVYADQMWIVLDAGRETVTGLSLRAL